MRRRSADTVMEKRRDLDCIRRALRSEEGTDRYALDQLRRKFLSFCSPGNLTLNQAEFSALMEHDGGCPPEARQAFFHAFRRSGARRVQRLLSEARAEAAAAAGEDPGQSKQELLKSLAEEEDEAEERRLSFRDFAEGVCAADPEDESSIAVKVGYLVDFFTIAPKHRFRFEVSLATTRWTQLRPVFLAAAKGGCGDWDFCIVRELNERPTTGKGVGCPSLRKWVQWLQPVFRQVVDFL